VPQGKTFHNLFSRADQYSQENFVLLAEERKLYKHSIDIKAYKKTTNPYNNDSVLANSTTQGKILFLLNFLYHFVFYFLFPILK